MKFPVGIGSGIFLLSCPWTMFIFHWWPALLFTLLANRGRVMLNTYATSAGQTRKNKYILHCPLSIKTVLDDEIMDNVNCVQVTCLVSTTTTILLP